MLCKECEKKVNPANGTIFIRGICQKCDKYLMIELLKRLKDNREAANAK